MAGDNEIILEFDGVKRRLPMPFKACLSKNAAAHLVEQLNLWMASDAYYGWLTIYPPVEPSEPNTKPRDWKA